MAIGYIFGHGESKNVCLNNIREKSSSEKFQDEPVTFLWGTAIRLNFIVVIFIVYNVN